MKTRFLKGVLLGAVVSGAVIVPHAALAGTGIGGVFNLGITNRTNTPTVLQGSTAGQQLRIANDASTGTGTTGIGIHTAANEHRSLVDSKTKVNNLNADLLDGQNVDRLRRRGRTHLERAPARDQPGPHATVLAVPSFGTIEASCAPTGFGMLWRNRTAPSTALDVWVVSHGVTRYVSQAANNIATPARDRRQGRRDVQRTGRVDRGTPRPSRPAGHWTPTGCVFHAEAVVQ